MVSLLILAAILVSFAGYFVWRGCRSKPGEVYHFRCPGCDLKVRYGAGDQGQRIQCPRCLRASTLNPYVQEPSRDRSSSRYRSNHLRRK